VRRHRYGLRVGAKPDAARRARHQARGRNSAQCRPPGSKSSLVLEQKWRKRVSCAQSRSTGATSAASRYTSALVNDTSKCRPARAQSAPRHASAGASRCSSRSRCDRGRSRRTARARSDSRNSSDPRVAISLFPGRPARHKKKLKELATLTKRSHRERGWPGLIEGAGQKTRRDEAGPKGRTNGTTGGNSDGGESDHGA